MGDRAAVLRRVLANPGLRRVALAFLGFGMAEYGVWVAALVYAYERGGTSTAALIAVAQLAPAAVVAPWAARFVDRHGAAVMLRIGYLVQAFAMGFTAASLLFDAPPPLTYAGAIVAASAVTLTRPAQAALLPGLVRTPTELVAANVVSGWVESVSLLLGPALAGGLIGLDGPGAAFAVFAGAVSVSAVLVARLDRPTEASFTSEPDRSADPGMSAMMVMRTEPGVVALLGVIAVQFVAIGALDVLVVVLALKVLALGASGAGYLNAAFGAGGVLGGVGALSLVGRQSLLVPLLGAAGGWGAAFLTLGAWPSAVGAFALLAAAGASRTVLDVAGRTSLQRVVPGAVRGRVFGVLEGLAMICLAVGSISVPVLVDLGGAQAALTTMGCLLVLVALAAAAALHAVERGLPSLEVELALLRASPLFGVLSAPVVEGLGRALVRRPAQHGEVVVREGDAGDRFYLVAEGTLAVSIDGVEVRTLSPGDGFGEIALLREGIRTATVTACGAVTLYALERAPFLEAVTGSRHAHRLAEDLVVHRLGTAPK